MSTTLSGEILIDGLQVIPRATDETVQAEQLALITGCPWALSTLKDTVESVELPDQLTIAVKGLDAESMYSAMEQSAEQSPFELMESAGCGGRDRFDRSDLASMSYRLSDTGNEIMFTSSTTTREHSTFTTNARISNSTPFTEMGLSPQAARQSRLEAATMTLAGVGHVNRTQSFCTDEMDVSKDAFIANHLQAWQASW